MISREDTIGHLLASSYFKAVIFAVMILLSKLYLDVVWTLYGDKLGTCPKNQVKSYDKSIMMEECQALLSEILKHDEHDADLRLLSAMLAQ